MGSDSTGLRRWTQSFTVLSATALVGYFTAVLLGVSYQTSVVIGLFGFVCPMIFGMAYLLLPAYVGQTLVDQRLAGVHFALTLGSAGLLVQGHLFDLLSARALGSLLWGLGVLVFLGSLMRTIVPELWKQARTDTSREPRPQRSTRLAATAIPFALGYLGVGTLGLAVNATTPAGEAVLVQRIVHYYAVGFGGLLIFALGARLMIGFFHVSLPRSVVWPVLVSGIIAPALLGTYLWVDPWFQIGAVLEAVAMIGYTFLVLFVAHRSDWDRVGLYGIALGAVSGTAAIVFGLGMAVGTEVVGHVAGHVSFVLGGFFPLTIVGYAYQFFPVTNGQFPGANRGVAMATIILLGIGVLLQGMGIVSSYSPVRSMGAVVSLVGAIGYWYLITGRFWS